LVPKNQPITAPAAPKNSNTTTTTKICRSCKFTGREFHIPDLWRNPARPVVTASKTRLYADPLQGRAEIANALFDVRSTAARDMARFWVAAATAWPPLQAPTLHK